MPEKNEWWLDAIDLRVSQGDVLTGLPVGVLASPVVFFRHATGKGGIDRWDITPTPIKRNDRVHMLAAGDLYRAVVLSYSCDLDKEHTGKVLVAPLIPLESIHPDHQAIVMQNGNFSAMPVPDVPGLGHHFADLRSITAVPRAVVDQATRVASMTPAGIAHLHARVTAFFTRLALPQ